MPTKVVNKHSCPTCGQSVNLRQIALFADLLKALWKVYRWCEQQGRRNFTRKEIKRLFTNENQTARFGDLELFGLVRRERKGEYVLNRETIDAFFSGNLAIPIRITKDPLTKQITVVKKGKFADVKTLADQLSSDGEFVARYRSRNDN